VTWIFDPDALAKALSDAGFDVDRTHGSPIGGDGSLTARRERGTTATLLAVDAGGRVRVTITRQAGAPESASATVDGAALRILTETTRTTTIAGTLTAPGQFQTLLAHLDRLGAGGESGPGLGDQAAGGARP